MAPDTQTSRAAYAAWIAVCLIWGTTYLGIRIALETIPPALLGGIRYAIAGAVLAVVLLARGERLPARTHWPGLALLAFLDSHENIQWNLGYEHSTYWGPRAGLQAGLGYTVMIVQRPDIADGVPFPAILPLGSLRYGDGTLFMTYIPSLGGGINHGSTLYLFGRVLLP